jgi:hypothetical protein
VQRGSGSWRLLPFSRNSQRDEILLIYQLSSQISAIVRFLLPNLIHDHLREKEGGLPCEGKTPGLTRSEEVPSY